MNWEIHHAVDEADVRRCWPVFQELRRNIATEEVFIDRWKRQRDEGYQVVYIERDGEVLAVGGYRLLHSMAWGRYIYLDDLAALTVEHGTGLGTAILRYVQQEARRLGCEGVHLDTGYQRQRAHRAYLRNGFDLNSHHLQWKADGE
jgi:GNAT superfamily N-acetyltransferase